MTPNEWKAIAIFGMGVYALSFFSINAAMFLLVAVGIAAFVNRFYGARNGTPAVTGGQGPK